MWVGTEASFYPEVLAESGSLPQPVVELPGLIEGKPRMRTRTFV